MQITVPFEFFVDIGISYIPNMKTCSVYRWNQNKNQADNK